MGNWMKQKCSVKNKVFFYLKEMTKINCCSGKGFSRKGAMKQFFSISKDHWKFQPTSIDCCYTLEIIKANLQNILFRIKSLYVVIILSWGVRNRFTFIRCMKNLFVRKLANNTFYSGKFGAKCIFLGSDYETVGTINFSSEFWKSFMWALRVIDLMQYHFIFTTFISIWGKMFAHNQVYFLFRKSPYIQGLTWKVKSWHILQFLERLVISIKFARVQI